MISYHPELNVDYGRVIQFRPRMGTPAEDTLGTRPSRMLNLIIHPSQTSQNMNAPKATTMNIAIA
jgi:hypothetical protein